MNHSHLHAALTALNITGHLADAGVDLEPKDYRAIVEAVGRDRADDQPGIDVEVDVGRLLDVEQFRLAQARVMELTPEHDGVVVPQVVLHMEGVPAQMTLTGTRSYLTALPGELAMGVGKAMLESGKVIRKAEQKLQEELTGPGGPISSVVTATPADMAREAANARAAEGLRGRG